MLVSKGGIDPNYCFFRRLLRVCCLSKFNLLSRSIPKVPVAHRAYHNAPSIAHLNLHPFAPGFFHRSTESSTFRSGSVTTPTFKMESRSKKIMTKPINLIFRFLQNRTRVEIWLYDNVHTRIQGCIIGFDEYMNLVLDEAVEMNTKTSTTTTLGRILLKGDTISLLTSAPHKT